jgi:hypothetical protein
MYPAAPAVVGEGTDTSVESTGLASRYSNKHTSDRQKHTMAPLRSFHMWLRRHPKQHQSNIREQNSTTSSPHYKMDTHLVLQSAQAAGKPLGPNEAAAGGGPPAPVVLQHLRAPVLGACLPAAHCHWRW